MKIRKLHFATAFTVSILLLTCHSGLMDFRKSDSQQKKALLKNGQADVRFFTYEVDGRKMHCTQAGADTLSLVLFLHGSPGSSSAILDYLADTQLLKVAQVAAVDRPGFGYSGFGKAEPSLENQAADVKPILEKCKAAWQAAGVEQKILLVGHSYGGPVIARMAMDSPELVDGLVIVAGSIDPDLEPKPWWQAPLDWRAIRWMLPTAFRVSNQEIIPLRQELTAMLPLWEKITCPVTVIQGMNDQLVPSGNADFARKMLVNSRHLDIVSLKNEGHFIFWTKRDSIVEKIIEMVERLDN